MATLEMELRFVTYGSAEWADARQLRYSLFFQPMGLSLSVLDDGEEQAAMHLVALAGNRVVGYGRLYPLENGEYRLSQMVVTPACQGQGIGRQILQYLVNQVRASSGSILRLDARKTAVGFYSKAGFQQVGEVFLSSRTGIPHVTMVMRL